MTSSQEIMILVHEAKLSAYFERLQTIYDLSCNLNSESDFETLVTKAESLETLKRDYEKVLVELNKVKLEVNPKNKADFQKLNAFDDLYCHIKRQMAIKGTTVRTTNQCAHSSKPKLPPIELKGFDGEPRNWPLFYSSFVDTIHSNPTLTSSDKLYYLIGKLTGKALSVYADITPSPDNYDIIFNALVSKYEDKRLLATSYLDTIFDYKAISSASQLEHFADRFSSSVSALKNLKLENLSDFILLYLALKKIDSETAHAFEMEKRKCEIPKLEDLLVFIRDQIKIYQRHGSLKSKPPSNQPAVKKVVKSFMVNSDSCCPVCSSKSHAHYYDCTKFQNDMNPMERYQIVKRNNSCVNCLSLRHTASVCKSSKACKHCNSRTHHSMLHYHDNNRRRSVTEIHPPRRARDTLSSRDNAISLPPKRDAMPATSRSYHSGMASSPVQPTAQVRSASYTDSNTVDDVICAMANTVHSSPHGRNVLLGTACAYAICNDGTLKQIRILIDTGSQNHFITKKCCKTLGIRTKIINNPLSIRGIGDYETQSIGIFAELTLASHYDSRYTLRISPLVLNKISDKLPLSSIDIKQLDYLRNITLADPDFYVPSQVDLILGSEVFTEILRPGKVVGPPGKPDAFETAFGYIILGSVDNLTNFPTISRTFFTSTDDSIEDLVAKFWSLQEVPCKKYLSPVELQCEQFFVDTTSRDTSGRFITALPFNRDPSCLGDSLVSARRRYQLLERKFSLNPLLRKEYDQIIREYLHNGIIEPAAPLNNKESFYVIPHHGVCRADKLTTKLRIVLDASHKTTSGISLNDCLHSGPNLQRDLSAIILNFRLYKTAFTADIKQMFLNLIVRKSDRRFLNILYRFEDESDLKLYNFNRVCFGLRCSPYLAMRAVRQLAMEQQQCLPLAADIASNYIYMDDLCISVRSPEEGASLAQDLIQLFEFGGFNLVKFISNSTEVLDAIPHDNRLSSQVRFDNDDSLKILGLTWCPREDIFRIAINFTPRSECTKRLMLSTVAKLWDLNGYCAPVVLYAKLLIQALWLSNVGWDDSPPAHICAAWKTFINELPLLHNFQIQRYFGIASDNHRVYLLGFSDASERAYGAVVYVCVAAPGEPNRVTLAMAKSRVAPTRTVSLARLELCSVLIMAQLLNFVHDSIAARCKVDDVFAFTDSSVALHWTHSSPHRFDTFVANRISKIQEYLAPRHFYHVEGKQNPSDCISRGLSPAQLIDHPLWMHGPPWARDDPASWPLDTFPFDDTANDKVFEYKNVNKSLVVCTATVGSEENLLLQLASRLSSWDKLLRVINYIFRFTHKLPRSEFVKSEHLKVAEVAILRCLQFHVFKDDFCAINSQRKVSKSLIPYAPFIDEDGLLRVGGRINKSSLSFDAKHPILLPKNHHITELIINSYHRKFCHPGPHLLLSLLRQRFWILSGRNIVRKCFRNCNKCFKSNPRALSPFMASLPAPRVNEAKPFMNTGVDYGGPYNILISRYRGARKEKAYICLFTCFVTRAVHLELAVDLSTEAFLRAFKRFISRRGECVNLFSDNGTNFVGAKTHFDELHKFLKSKSFRESFNDEALAQGINWTMNPPSSPHFGGVWETNIRSVKLHLKRVVGETLLTYEEMYTLLTQIECVLNSRPLTVMSSDPSEPTALSPSHFLTLGPLRTFHSIPCVNTKLNLLHRKQLLDNIVHSYWNRWRKEYLSELQTRSKWNTPSNPVKKGLIVIVKSDNCSPLNWPLAIIDEVHPGSDGVIRVATVRTKTGTYVRPVAKLCPLPSQ